MLLFMNSNINCYCSKCYLHHCLNQGSRRIKKLFKKKNQEKSMNLELSVKNKKSNEKKK